MTIAEIECRKLQNLKKMSSKKKQQEAPKCELKDNFGYKKQIMSSAFFGFDVIFWMVYGWFHTIVDVFIQAYIIYKKIFSNIP